MASFTTEELISAVLERPALWKANDPCHSNKDVTKRMWDEIKQLAHVDNSEFYYLCFCIIAKIHHKFVSNISSYL